MLDGSRRSFCFNELEVGKAESPRGLTESNWNVNEIGRTCISNQYFSPPVHLSKPYFDKESASLLLNLSCPTAGLLEGDRVVSSIEVGSGASLVVTTPGATRAHFMRSGLALVEQRFVVRTGGFLEFNPGALILQRQANLRQDTILEIEEVERLYWSRNPARKTCTRRDFQIRPLCQSPSGPHERKARLARVLSTFSEMRRSSLEKFFRS